MKKIRNIESSNSKELNILTYIIIIESLIASIVLLFFLNDYDPRASIFGYYLPSKWARSFTFIMKCNFYYMVYPCATNLLALFYITLCLRCSKYIKYLTKEIQRCPPDGFDFSNQLNILTRKAHVDNIILDIQATLSLPVFFIIIANTLMFCSIIGWFLEKSWRSSDHFWKMESSFFVLNSVWCVTSVLWISGGLPIEVSKFKQTFHRKTHARCLVLKTLDEADLKRDLFYDEDSLMMGCDILSYKRSTLFALIGTVFTYTILARNAELY
ncbi:hypothetical protein HNY73_009523 [Argiope bruennichi]|uniref:Uncharacterized protein n=1 Tax=Argiope bruennichi TaxID=94029 RepID=A0A8T0FFD1_ARGBR|nr:hypothetical protein HNY73_009523 [Argiope bruennichi]